MRGNERDSHVRRFHECQATRSVATVTPATAISFFRPEFNDFLYAPIGADKNEMPLSVLSALTRLNVDPWAEAAELSELPRDTATRRLVALIGRLPGGQGAQTDAKVIAHRLIELLPRGSGSNVRPAEEASSRLEISRSTFGRLLIGAGLVIVVLLFAANREPSSRGGRIDPPASSTTSPPQTVPQ
jgi:hypothetical protein